MLWVGRRSLRPATLAGRGAEDNFMACVEQKKYSCRGFLLFFSKILVIYSLNEFDIIKNILVVVLLYAFT